MKKLLLFVVSLLNVVATYAIEANYVFGIEQQKTPEGYQQYVGQTFFVRPAYGPLETWRKSGFEYSEEYKGRVFRIEKVTVKDVELNKEPNKEVAIVAKEVNGKQKIKFKGYENVSIKVSIWSGVKQWPLIGNMPIVLTAPFDEYKKQHLHEIVKNDTVKDSYEIVDVEIGKGSAKMAEPIVTVKNMRTGEKLVCPYAERLSKPFSKALEGAYKLSLVRVEKPEDAADRYGKIETIKDASVDKYSYKDNIISIVIFGGQKQFDFTITNVSAHSIKVIWNEAAFVGLDGSSSKIMHVGTKYSQRESDQPATTIIKGAKLDDNAVPTANVYYDEGVKVGYSTVGSGWKKRSMLPKSYIGKEAGEIKLMLPIQVKDVVNEYTFVFKVYYSYYHPELLNTELL